MIHRNYHLIQGTLFLVLFALICFMGQAPEIRDNPASIWVLGAVSLGCLAMSLAHYLLPVFRTTPRD